jgi:hypothetical protein
MSYERVHWRKGWDSNPRYPCRHAGFQDRCLKPLGHPSKPLLSFSYLRDARCRNWPFATALLPNALSASVYGSPQCFVNARNGVLRHSPQDAAVQSSVIRASGLAYDGSPLRRVSQGRDFLGQLFGAIRGKDGGSRPGQDRCRNTGHRT